MNIQPVDGAYLAGVPTVPMSVEPAIGERLIRTGAFTEGGAGGPVPDGIELEATLNFYDPPDPPPADADQQPEGPADAGPSDSSEV